MEKTEPTGRGQNKKLRQSAPQDVTGGSAIKHPSQFKGAGLAQVRDGGGEHPA